MHVGGFSHFPQPSSFITSFVFSRKTYISCVSQVFRMLGSKLFLICVLVFAAEFRVSHAKLVPSEVGGSSEEDRIITTTETPPTTTERVFSTTNRENELQSDEDTSTTSVTEVVTETTEEAVTEVTTIVMSDEDATTTTEPIILKAILNGISSKDTDLRDEGFESDKKTPSYLYSEEVEEEGEAVPPRAPKIAGDAMEKVVIPKAGENVTLTCTVTGFPTPKVVWYEGHETDEEKKEISIQHMVVNAEDHSVLATLTLAYIDCEDVGKYTCAAGNFLGKASKKFLLDIPSCNQSD